MMPAFTPAELLAAKNAAERIVQAFEAWDLRGREFKVWEHYVQVLMAEEPRVARTLLAMPGVQAAHWTPALAGGRT